MKGTFIEKMNVPFFLGRGRPMIEFYCPKCGEPMEV
jgi:hypothetical protein